MFSIVRNILLDGDGNAVQIPHYANNGYLDDLEPMDMSKVQFSSLSYGYSINYGGRPYMPDEVLHFIANPDPQKPWIGKGYRVLLNDLAGTLKQSPDDKNRIHVKSYTEYYRPGRRAD